MPKIVPRYLRATRKVVEPERRSIPGEELFWPVPGPAGIVVTEDTALRLPALLAAITGLAQDVATLPRNVYQRQADGGRRGASEHAVEPLLTLSPDGETTPIAWWASLLGHALQRGNGYAEIVRRGRGTPSSLHLLDSKATRPERRDGVLGYRLDNQAWLPGRDVLHIAGFGGDGLTGYSMTRLLNQSIGVGLAAEGYASDYFANGAEPGGIIEHPQTLSREALKKFKEDWDSIHRGQGHRHTPAMLQGGAKWTPTSINPEQSQMIETRKFQANDVPRPWRVPPHKYGDFSQAHLANIEASNLDYLQTALMWWLETIEQQCNLKLLTRSEWDRGYYIEHNVNALLRGDVMSRFSAYGKALNDGWMNPDEVRRRENFNPIGAERGGETYLVNPGRTPLDQAGSAAAAAAAAGVPARGLRFNPHHDPGSGQFISGGGGGSGGGAPLPRAIARITSNQQMTDRTADWISADCRAGQSGGAVAVWDNGMIVDHTGGAFRIDINHVPHTDPKGLSSDEFPRRKLALVNTPERMTDFTGRAITRRLKENGVVRREGDELQVDIANGHSFTVKVQSAQWNGSTGRYETPDGFTIAPGEYKFIRSRNGVPS